MARPLGINPLNYVVNRQYSDSLVIKNKLFKERLRHAKNLFREDLLAHYGCVNAIEFSDEGDLLVSGGDDRRVLLWFVPDAVYGRGTPVVMQTNHTSNIFCLAFDKLNSKIFSGGNDDQVIVHDMKTGGMILKLPHRNPVYGLSVNPQNDSVLATAGDDGRILIFDIRSLVPEGICLAKQNTGFHSVVFHPTNPRLLVTANADEGIALWDCRKVKKELVHYDPLAGKISGISACFNSTGSHVLALRRRLPPVMYATQNASALCQFYHPQYYNSCTMKTCCFAGDEDEYVLSGSDDFNLYMWSVPEDGGEWGNSHIVLHGHRSIVNQVRYNKNNNLIASSGVEKMVKLWSTLPIGKWSGSLLADTCDAQRTVYSKDDYNSIIGPSTPRISHDYSDQSTQEDLRMMAFFDSLIQTEIQNWNSMSEDTFTSDSDSDKQTQENIRLSWQSLLKCRKSAEETLWKHKPNRIALLIAQKRNKLAKMAHWKSSALVQRYNCREKHRKRKSSHKFKASSASAIAPGSHHHKYRKNNGVSSKNATGHGGKRITRSCSTSGVAATGTHREREPMSKRNAHLHHHHHQQHHDRHPHQRQHEDRNNRSRSDTTVVARKKYYRTRSQSLREVARANTESVVDSASFDVPSTSTGITGTSASVYRVIEQDSDEEGAAPSVGGRGNFCGSDAERVTEELLEGDNFVDIIPTPLNGSHDMYINMLETNNNNNNNGNNNNSEVVRSEECSGVGVSGLSSSAESEDEFADVIVENDNNNNNNNSDSYSDSNGRYENYATPLKKRRRQLSEIDSGFATSSSNSYFKRGLRRGATGAGTGGATCSAVTSGSRSSRSIAASAHSSDDDCHYEKFRRRVKKARVNIRKQMIGGDSDTN